MRHLDLATDPNFIVDTMVPMRFSERACRCHTHAAQSHTSCNAAQMIGASFALCTTPLTANSGIVHAHMMTCWLPVQLTELGAACSSGSGLPGGIHGQAVDFPGTALLTAAAGEAKHGGGHAHMPSSDAGGNSAINDNELNALMATLMCR